MSEQEIAEQLREARAEDGRVSCAAMHSIARRLGVEPAKVGKTCTESGIRASDCQLGLFGHGLAREGKGRVVRSDVDVSEGLAARIRSAAPDGRVSCAELWKIASEFKLPRLFLGSAAETLGLKITPCQLGFF
jgi:hypothetical protein